MRLLYRKRRVLLSSLAFHLERRLRYSRLVATTSLESQYETRILGGSVPGNPGVKCHRADARERIHATERNLRAAVLPHVFGLDANEQLVVLRQRESNDRLNGNTSLAAAAIYSTRAASASVSAATIRATDILSAGTRIPLPNLVGSANRGEPCLESGRPKH